MVKKLKSKFLGTTKKLPDKKQVEKLKTEVPVGCLFQFSYRGKGAVDPNPFIIMISPKWVAKNGGTYFTGVNLNFLRPDVRQIVIEEFGSLPVGSVSYVDIKAYAPQDPNCCVRTYNVRNVRALHKVGGQ